uniref:RPAP1/MINIYO-like TPR repeats domain-containing protein n=1 Tax=Meloidogyne javanica TaxID=6303 RepID=A0A915M0P8_MELJA
DPVQQDLALKSMRNILPRKEQQILKIFDQFSNTKATTDSQINENREQQIVRICRERLEEIRSLYLEQIEDATTGRRTWIFAKGIVDIFANEAWILIPIRKVLDAVNQRSSTTPTSDDIEIIYLCLLWAVSLFLEKPTLFKALTSVNAFCVRLAEVFLIGPEIFCNEAINELIGIITDKFLIESANKKMLKFQLEDTIAGLDAFMPFFVDLLKCFEEFSNGNENFCLIILLIIYLNNSPKINKLRMAQILWSLQRNVVRQMNILINDTNEKFVEILINQLNEEENIQEEEDQNIIQKENKLVSLYLINLNQKIVTKERNPILYLIATKHLDILKKKKKELKT